VGPDVTAPPGDQQQAVSAMRHLQRLSAERSRVRPPTTEEVDALDEALGGKCAHCGGYHVRACPRVRRIEWHSNGHISSVEFWPSNRVDWTGVVFEDESDDNGPYLLLRDVEDDIHLVVDTFRRSNYRAPGGDELTAVIKAMRRLELVIEEARAQGVQSDGAEPA